MRILIIEDEKKLADSLAQVLKKHNYIVDVAYDGIDGEEQALANIHDLILLDVMLPKQDGFEVLSALRAQDIQIPILMLTAKDRIQDKIRGLDYGADDYIAKPFDTQELLARIRANLRRRNVAIEDDELVFHDIVLDKANLIVKSRNDQISLTLKEAEILELLMSNQQSITTKELLLDKVWGYDSDANFNHVEVYISFLRKKLKYLSSTTIIQTIRGVGYKLTEVSDV
ncbi:MULTISPECIES: response regulator transcription factor [unclassified Breznakia]|uniref:response regulator transcription factor n=1 Tax=unclassified Breznakia TaxID=2623764 RepID=UPI002473AB3B|nr:MULTISPECIES: response regulator transcription factor [unclassified Breznakia]MDH6365984.1 two-component system response regulator ArlR [Breznakia sp. PH1-1]MDH6403084.1 two-component system response regulator ArlR [Breznakia sp. PF1-11]MDH6410793.1 two-component system response regulator ArlR [Breznakia sp. PFB1-11]MDH6413150.1 two-component system response regulator ArlR [Breznakia sp. PFB1-14]MDH6415518.1 two-component system response regulator ArlR [Breznakia sp. PFB1-4]